MKNNDAGAAPAVVNAAAVALLAGAVAVAVEGACAAAVRAADAAVAVDVNVVVDDDLAGTCTFADAAARFGLDSAKAAAE